VKSRAEQKEATREHLFAHAMRLIDARGFADVGVDDIVREADVARGTFYFHFPSKDDLLLELIARNDRLIVERMAKGAKKRSLRAVLRATTDAFGEVWRDRRALLPHAGAVALRRIAEVEEQRDKQPLRLALAGHVGDAIASGDIAPRLPPQVLADLFLLDVFAALMAWARTGQPALDVIMDAVIDLFLHGALGPSR
jgi:AcrR family transcriptional regulator